MKPSQIALWGSPGERRGAPLVGGFGARPYRVIGEPHNCQLPSFSGSLVAPPPIPRSRAGFWWQGDFLVGWGFSSHSCEQRLPWQIAILCWPRYQVTFYLRFPFNFVRELDGDSSQGKLLPFSSEFPSSSSKCRIKVPRPSSLKASQPSGPRRSEMAHPPLFPQVCSPGLWVRAEATWPHL